MTTNIVYPAAGIGSTASVEVHTRDLWSDPWTERPDLQCTSCTFAAQPSLSSATFRHRYGVLAEWNTTGTSTRNRFTVNPRSYVRATITPTPGVAGADPIRWYGIWKHATDAGLVQALPAIGLDGLLQFSRIADAKYVDMFGTIRDAGRGLTFNAGGKPNRTASKRPSTCRRAIYLRKTPTAPSIGRRVILSNTWLKPTRRPTTTARLF